MGWKDLLLALDEEAGRETEALALSARRDAAVRLEDARRATAAEREAALARVRREAEDARRRALTGAARERARAVLEEKRRILDDVRAEVAQRLRERSGQDLARLVDRIAPEVGAEPSVWTVDRGEEDALRERLARAWPATASGAQVEAAEAARGGVEVRIGAGRRVLDATVDARLERIWAELEPELAAALFGSGDGEP